METLPKARGKIEKRIYGKKPYLRLFTEAKEPFMVPFTQKALWEDGVDYDFQVVREWHDLIVLDPVRISHEVKGA